MKIRSGFVSNSSSSSFILRGIKIKKEELIQKLKISKDELDLCEDNSYEILELISSKLNSNLDIKPTGNYFGNLDFDNLIIGDNMGHLEDGEVTEIDELADDTTLLEKLKKLGLTGELKTYVQMVSNDNY